jgi:hypothetical protein
VRGSAQNVLERRLCRPLAGKRKRGCERREEEERESKRDGGGTYPLIQEVGSGAHLLAGSRGIDGEGLARQQLAAVRKTTGGVWAGPRWASAGREEEESWARNDPVRFRNPFFLRNLF